MTRINAKGPTARARAAKAAQRLRAYRKICQLVDERDEHRCRCCYSVWDLEHHHLRPRSLGRDDSAANLLLLCATHHRQVTDKRLVIIGTDANGSLGFHVRPEAE